MLLKCPECELQVSDKALTCPHCGYPLVSKSSSASRPHKKKRLRLPNGFGQITEIKNKNLRKPFRVMISVGKTPTGRPIQQLLKPEAYFETYNDAYMALVEYNKDPYTLDQSITLQELYDVWSAEYFKKLSNRSSERAIVSAWNKSSKLYNMRASDIRSYHLKTLILESDATDSIKSRMKSMFNLMFDYALEHEIVTVNVARAFSLSDHMVTDEPVRGHMIFKDEEMNILWGSIDIPWVDVILVQCYSGWRPQELGNIMINDVDLEKWTFSGGMKTDSGKNRVVPIHSCIRDIVRKHYDRSVKLGSPYLFTCDDSTTHSNSIRLTYDKYEYRFSKIMKDLDLNTDHRPHDPRKHFISMAKKYKVDEYAIKYIAGHKISDITEAVYTEREEGWLNEEIEKIQR